MSGRNAPLSPIAISGSHWVLPTVDKDRSFPDSRGQLITPPNSGGLIEAMNGGFPPGSRSVGGPSPPPSIGRSSTSTATHLYARSEVGRGHTLDEASQEAILAEHYVALQRYLATTSRDGKTAPPPNKARDKLQRLTSVQFLELSTDVYDELKRRESLSRRLPNAPPTAGPPPFLPPQDNFHPKRNQARQKLSSLGPPRFRDLATDVFCELERRVPRFAAGDMPRMGSPMSRAPSSRSGTPVDGNSNRGAPRRRPSEASSTRSGRGPNGYGSVPMSPGGMTNNGEYGRPMPKQFQSHTIVPNKSTMVEEDDELDSPTGFGEGDRDVADRKLVEDYEQQIRELREKLDRMEDVMRRKEDDIHNAMDEERGRTTALNAEKRAWDKTRAELEDRLAMAEDLSASLRDDLQRLKDNHANEMRQWRDQRGRGASGGGSVDLERETQDLRAALREQQQVTDEVRREAQGFLQEMRMLSEQSQSAWERQAELEKTVDSLEKEVRDWRNRYARAKTQLRNVRTSSIGLSMEQDSATKLLREKGFVRDNGLVRDVFVSKFQMAIDELLQRARDKPESTLEAVKAVAACVRKMSNDLDAAAPGDEATSQQYTKLKTRMSATANNLITASQNFAASAGISPVSLVDAAASHLVAAVVELLRVVKIRPTPAHELELDDDDDDGSVTPVHSTSAFSPRSNSHTQSNSSSAVSTQDSRPPPPFQGLGGKRGSADSSAYSPNSSPRESFSPKGATRTEMSNGAAYSRSNGSSASGTRDLKDFLEDRAAVLVRTITDLVALIRKEAAISELTPEIESITYLVGEVVARTRALGPEGAKLVERLASGRQRLVEAGHRGQDLAADGHDTRSREWRMWTATLPPIAFEVNREAKELVQSIDDLVRGARGAADDFS